MQRGVWDRYGLKLRVLDGDGRARKGEAVRFQGLEVVTIMATRLDVVTATRVTIVQVIVVTVINENDDNRNTTCSHYHEQQPQESY